MKSRVLLLVPTTTYKATDFLEAARSLGADVVIGSDRRQALEGAAPGGTVTLDFRRPLTSIDTVRRFSSEYPIQAILGVDDETTVLAARIAEAMDLPSNPIGAVRASRDKFITRRLLRAAGLRTPWFRRVSATDSPEAVAAAIEFPCVIKPLSLSASRGVLRTNDETEFVAAFPRVVRLLEERDVRNRSGDAEHVLVEGYLPGVEVALEGLLDQGSLRTLALLDKPDPLEGPTFEETIFVTPSRLEDEVQRAISAEVAEACRAIGLVDGPVHAELRVHDGEPWMLEVAARTIGGLCSRTLRFGTGISLEELVLRHALGMKTDDHPRESAAAGVSMLPVPSAGVLRGVEGIAEAESVPGIVEVTMTLHIGAKLVPLPEGHQYLGFVFARGDSPQQVEASLREANGLIRFEVDGG